MPFRRKRMSALRLKQSVKHTDTAILTIGGASTPSEVVLLETDAGARTVDGSTQNIIANQTTDNTVTVGCTVKYINFIIECASRPAETSGTSNDGVGWVEWAIVMVKESETTLPITNVGANGLGDVATKMYRNECIYTGCIPCSRSNPNCQNITIKVPKFKQVIRLGDEWRLYVIYRDVLVTSTATDSARVNIFTHFKSYQ